MKLCCGCLLWPQSLHSLEKWSASSPCADRSTNSVFVELLGYGAPLLTAPEKALMHVQQVQIRILLTINFETIPRLPMFSKTPQRLVFQIGVLCAGQLMQSLSRSEATSPNHEGSSPWKVTSLTLRCLSCAVVQSSKAARFRARAPKEDQPSRKDTRILCLVSSESIPLLDSKTLSPSTVRARQ